jgi:hypothetical protein
MYSESCRQEHATTIIIVTIIVRRHAQPKPPRCSVLKHAELPRAGHDHLLAIMQPHTTLRLTSVKLTADDDVLQLQVHLYDGTQNSKTQSWLQANLPLKALWSGNSSAVAGKTVATPKVMVFFDSITVSAFTLSTPVAFA